MNTSRQTSRYGSTVALSGWLLIAQAVHGAPPPDAPASADDLSGQGGGLFSALTQAFGHDFDRDVVWGHFDVGSPPHRHRFYCLVDPKTGKDQKNGTAGQPFVRPDGMTGLKSPAVSLNSCAEAQRLQILVTSGYVLSGRAVHTAAAPRAPTAAPASSAEAAPAAASAAAAASAPVPAPAGMASADGRANADVLSLHARFIAGQNAHDAAAVSGVLLHSGDFVWGQSGGGTIWGYEPALAAFERDWKGTWRLEPQLAESRLTQLAPGSMLLVTPLLLTSGNPGEDPTTVPVRWACVFVNSGSDWRIASIFMAPFKGWHPRGGG